MYMMTAQYKQQDLGKLREICRRPASTSHRRLCCQTSTACTRSSV